jgi:hypothetical protein
VSEEVLLVVESVFPAEVGEWAVFWQAANRDKMAAVYSNLLRVIQ